MAKGGNYERQVCKELSLWWSDNRTDDCFWRSSQSGGRSTVRARKGKKTEGHDSDIVATSKRGRRFMRHFAVEIKCGYNNAPNASLSDTLTSPTNRKGWTLSDWIRQTIRAQKRADVSHWILIHKPDFREPIVYMNYDVMYLFRKCMGYDGEHKKFTGIATIPFRIKKDTFITIGFMPFRILKMTDPALVLTALEN